MSRGIRLGVDFVLRQRSKLYVNGKLFLEYINSTFILYLNELRELEEFAGCEAILLMNNCLLHMGDAVIEVLTRERVGVNIFNLHTTHIHIFQMLDVMLFGTLKKHVTGFSTLDEDQPTAAFIIKVYHDFKQTMVEVNIWGAFHPSDSVTHDIDQNPYGLLFNEEKFRQSLGFLELWERNVPLESLSKRKQQAGFGWINKPE
jgi:hypothetical protein